MFGLTEAGPAIPTPPDDGLCIAGHTLGSRLILGTGGMTSLDVLGAALRASGTAMATVAVRRVEAAGQGSLLALLRDSDVRVLPNTAGCHSVKEAVTTAHMAREVFATPWIKLEVIG